MITIKYVNCSKKPLYFICQCCLEATMDPADLCTGRNHVM